MCATLVGDLSWLKQAYGMGGIKGHRLTCLSGEEGNLGEFVSASDVVVLLTDQLNHVVRRRVVDAASDCGVPVYMRHSSGVAAVPVWLRNATDKL